jgi:GH24 family phage-related lysozyme (muramidase)
MGARMNVDRVVGLLKGLEGFRPYVYDDRSPWPRTEVARLDCRAVGGQYRVNATGGTATIGYGETEANFIDLYWGRRIMQADALAKMAERVKGFHHGVRGCITADLTEHQWEAVTCRAYQTGAGGFCRSETARLLNDGFLASALAKWRTEFAHPDRSEVEIAHFLTPDEEAPVTRIYTRDEIGFREPLGITRAQGMTRGFGLHHLGDGWGPTGDVGESIAALLGVQDFHMGPERGWNDIGYNWAVDHLGNAFTLRGSRVRNAANGGDVFRGYDSNAAWGSILYLAGTSGPLLTGPAKDAVWAIAGQEGWTAGDWLPHRIFTGSACPGEDRIAWLDAGHPRDSVTPPPTPTPPEDDDMAGLFIFDYVPDGTDKPVAILYTDGRLKWGLKSAEQLAFYATGKVPHLGPKGSQFYGELDWHPGGALLEFAAKGDEPTEGLVEVEDGHYSLAGGITEAMGRSTFETGDPGCG